MATQADINRELLAVAINVSVVNYVKEIDKVLSGDASITSIVNRGLFFVPQAMEARASLVRAREQLLEQFLPAALNAIRDRSRPLHETQKTISNYMEQLQGQYGVSMEIIDTSNMSNAAAVFFKKVKEDINDPSKVPWWGWIGVAVAAAYVIRTFK